MTTHLPTDSEIIAAVTAAIARAESRGEYWCDHLPAYCHEDHAHESDGDYVATLSDGRIVWLAPGDKFGRCRIA